MAAQPSAVLPDLSVVIPIYNEARHLEPLYRECAETLTAWGRPYEIILVDDGSTDDTSRSWRSCRRPTRACA